MRSISSRLGAAGLIASLLLGSSAAGAAPLVVARDGGQSANIITVQSDGFRHRNGAAFYNGHRGYREWRHGYRYYNGFWFPPAAFVAGAVIGGAIAAAPMPAPNPHVDWCLANVPGYNPYDNTFQPAYGPRQTCHSPYGG